MEVKVRSVESEPSALIEKIRRMAHKREQQAVSAADKVTAQELYTTAESYRALAEALANTERNKLG